MAAPLVSVVMRSHNDAPFIGTTLVRLSSQDLPGGFEIVSIDDHSSDGTAERLALQPEIRRISPPDGPYFPGRTLNAAVRHCLGEFVVFNNADAIPQGGDYLARLVAPLQEDPGVCAVYGQQIPRPDAEWLVRKDYRRAFGDGRIAATWGFFFSLASAAIRRADLLAHPFDERIRYSEDVEWAWRAVQRGGRIRYAADAVAEHSHNYSFAELRRRFYNEGYANGRIFGGTVSLATAWRQFLAETARDCIALLPHPSAWPELLLKAARRRWLQKFCTRKGQNDYAREHAVRPE